MLLFDVISLIHQFLIHISDKNNRIHILPNFHIFPTLLLPLESVYYKEYITPAIYSLYQLILKYIYSKKTNRSII